MRPFLSSKGTDVIDVQVVLTIRPAKLQGPPLPGSDRAHRDGGTWNGNRGPSPGGLSKEMPSISWIISENISYHSVQKLLSSSLLSKSINIKVYRTVILPVVWDEHGTLSFKMRETQAEVFRE
jgi:hypothetical protein